MYLLLHISYPFTLIFWFKSVIKCLSTPQMVQVFLTRVRKFKQMLWEAYRNKLGRTWPASAQVLNLVWLAQISICVMHAILKATCLCFFSTRCDCWLSVRSIKSSAWAHCRSLRPEPETARDDATAATPAREKPMERRIKRRLSGPLRRLHNLCKLLCL